MEYRNALGAVEDIKWTMDRSREYLELAQTRLDALERYLKKQETVPDIKTQ